MQYLWFTVLFTVVHVIAYTVAGVIALRISKDLYEGEGRVLDYMRDTSDPDEGAKVQKRFFPAQLLRGVLMSLVFYPILGPVGELGAGIRFLFLFGLMFLYTDFASAVPFGSNIEGYVYLKDRYLGRAPFWKFQAEMLIYSTLLGLAGALFLF
jgi:hypothetical protein